MRLATIAWRGLIEGHLRNLETPEDCDTTLTTLLSCPVKHMCFHLAWQGLKYSRFYKAAYL